MEYSSTTDIILAIVTILASLGTAIGTFANTRNQVKQVDIDVKKIDKTLQVEVSDKVNRMTLDLAEKLEEQLEECTIKKEQLEQKLSKLATKKTESALRLHFLVGNLRNIIDKHNELADKNCPGYLIINDMVLNLIDEIEKEIKEEKEVK